MTQVIAKTERTSIRALQLGDADFMMRLMQTPGWLRYIGDRNIHSLEDAQTYLQNGLLKLFDETGFGYYLISLHSGEPIGVAGFLRKAFLDHEDFGFALMPQYHAKGLAYEASTALLNYGQEQHGFTVLDAVTSLDNSASQSLLVKLSFARIGDVQDGAERVALYRWRE